MLEKLKERWGLKHNYEVFVILLVFSITGSAAMMVRKLVFNLLDIGVETSMWIKIPMYILTILPSYQILLLVIGTLLGQHKFFYNFQKKSIGRFYKKRTKNSQL